MDQKEFILSGRRFQLDKAVMSVRMQKWAGIIHEAAVSGLTKTEFCARKGIDRRQFFHWQKQIREYVLQHNPELGLPPAHGQMQQIQSVNAQIMPSLPVFCEIKPKEELPAVYSETAKPAAHCEKEMDFMPELMPWSEEYRRYEILERMNAPRAQAPPGNERPKTPKKQKTDSQSA